MNFEPSTWSVVWNVSVTGGLFSSLSEDRHPQSAAGMICGMSSRYQMDVYGAEGGVCAMEQ